MKRFDRICKIAVFSLLFLFALSGCNHGQQGDTEYQLYYLDQDELSLYASEYVPTERVTDTMVEEVIKLMQVQVNEKNYKSLLPEDVSVLGYQFENGRVTLNFSKEYKDMPNTREILVRAGFVKVLIQIPGVTEVQFMQNGIEMVDSQGNTYPVMTADTFVESDGNNINAYQYATLNLYFPEASGEYLVKEQVSVYYSSNVPLEQVIVEQLQKGPRVAGHQSVIPSETKILGVSVMEDVCYVNLDSSFNSPMVVTNADPEVLIYAIVNSIMDASDVDKVQISIDGETDVEFRSSVSLNQFFTRNRDLIVEEINE